ncbi:MAG: DNA-directed RNA polymerase subunit beta' [Planctomycetota bacterium]
MEQLYDQINDCNAISIKLASPEEIKRWSYGEVKKPETINYRTYRPERDGLFCERIFGPEKDFECFCGKYKGIKYKGNTCDRCGVEITVSRVRRKRMGHIQLAAPIVHIWFFKIVPSVIGNLLSIKTSSLERIIYYQDFVVTDVKNKKCPLKVGQLLNDEQVAEYNERYPGEFSYDIGGRAVKTLLANLKLEEVSKELKSKSEKLSPVSQKAKEILKRHRLVKDFLESENKPEWMVMDVIPVIPPDLRPLVLLDSGNFATSDLNDLYRRLINCNNRLKKLIELNAPEVIIRNEKRMLQQAVDVLFDNERCRRHVLDSAGRPLKSLSDMIKGKQGRFRQNLLGKRVDYSARSVIVVGPELKLHQCGLPKRIALEIYQPFVIKRLKELGKADTIKSAKKMIESRTEDVWDVLVEVIKDHPVMLNRAPTLHRMGIQAFEPILIEGNAITVHPFVCPPFNADFDGDQMAVHLPLSWEAQLETKLLMMSSQNIFSPAHGNPVIGPTQDVVMGIHYLMLDFEDKPVDPQSGQKPSYPTYSTLEEAMLAYSQNKIKLHTPIFVKIGDKKVLAKNGPEKGFFGRYKTTLGRLTFNDLMPVVMPYYNYELDKKLLNQIIYDCHNKVEKDVFVKILDSIKDLGFGSVTVSGLSISKDDLRVPEEKDAIIKFAEEAVNKIENNYRKGIVTSGERYNQIIDIWTHAREKVADAMINVLKNDYRDGKRYLNPIYHMMHSGARGSIDQVRQLSGMRGLMAKPSGEIIETPIKANLREGLNILEYFSSTHGARKGLADTALKTANAGYLTRKLVDVAQNMVINIQDCGTLNGITKSVIYKGEKVETPLAQTIFGRSARDNIVDIVTDEVIVKENDLITKEIAKKIEDLGYQKIRVRSPLTCEASEGLCARCYGMDLSTGKLVEEGMAVGVIAAQSIGEPGTQLTMRTFHIGGTASRAIEESQILTKNAGIIRYQNLKTATDDKGKSIVVNRNGEIAIMDSKDREIERYLIPPGATLMITDGAQVKQHTVMASWDPHNVPILAEKDGIARFEDIIKNITMREEIDPRSGIKRRVIIEHKGDRHPQIIIEDENKNVMAVYTIPEKAHIEIDEGEKVQSGMLLAKTPRELGGTQDITGGLPRVTELLEARRPKDPAVIAEIDGVVEFGEKKAGKRTIIIYNKESDMRSDEHIIPPGKYLRVHRGDSTKAGDALTNGPLVLQDILRINGIEALQEYLLKEVQGVYRAQNVTVSDKHIEIIISQMLRRVRIYSPGDTSFLPGTIIDKFRFAKENERVMKKNNKPATAKPTLIGITKASLQSDSFIAAASFQETTRVLAEAAIAGRFDQLKGLKENVILGRIIPCGTGFPKYREEDKKDADN